MTGSPGSRRPAIALWVHVAALGGYTVLCVAWSLFAGRDLNWDQLNHHLYLGHLWHHGRLDRDFMAAGGQSYYNPLPYLPFHALVVGGWSSNTITALLGVLHSLNAWLLHAIGWSVFRGRYSGPGNQIFLGELEGRQVPDQTRSATALAPTDPRFPRRAFGAGSRTMAVRLATTVLSAGSQQSTGGGQLTESICRVLHHWIHARSSSRRYSVSGRLLRGIGRRLRCHLHLCLWRLTLRSGGARHVLWYGRARVRRKQETRVDPWT